MSIKNEFLKLLDEFSSKKDSALNEIKNVEASTDTFSDEYITKRVFELKDDLKKLSREYSTKLIKIINDAISSKEESNNKRIRETMHDASYQAGLSNFVKGIELGAYDHADIQKMATENYSNDYYAIKLINSAMDLKGMALVIPDTFEKNINYLRRTKENVEKYVNYLPQYKNSGFHDFGIIGIKDFIENNFDDDLNYIQK